MLAAPPRRPRLAGAPLLLALLGGAALAAEPPRELGTALDPILERGGLAGARVGILVSEVESGKVLYARDADVLLNPASNVKLFTAAAALARLGPEYRFETEFRVDGPSAGRAAVRSLFIRGKGDPTLGTERLWTFAGELAGLGLQRIGELVLDDSWFDGERVGPGFDQEIGDHAYLAPTGALSLNFNTVAVHVVPGEGAGSPARVTVEPASDYVRLAGAVRTAGPRAAITVAVASTPEAGRQRIAVDGAIPSGSRPVAVARKVDDPAAYFGETLKRLLELRGVRVGRVRAGAAPEDAKPLWTGESESLAEIVRRLNKTSNNFVAEQLVKALGAEARGAPGSWAAGIDAVEGYLEEVGLPRGSFVMRNGSGLNDANRFSARQAVALLRSMARRFPIGADFVASLPVAARDGTIRSRMGGTEAAGRLRAKTGTLGNVTSLSGLVETAEHRLVAFAIIVNDLDRKAGAAARTVDALAAAIAAWPGAAPTDSGPPAWADAAENPPHLPPPVAK
jgi:D-alanyl-D-alanine carboxypeptidase/D-alanyl-D-alanine-endopeptidase (penicillin-binding protein 4)